MRAFSRSIVVVFLAVGIFGGGVFACSLLGGPDGPIGVLKESFSALVSEWTKHEELDQQTEILVRRNFLKSEILNRLVAEKIDVRQAVEEFEAVMEQVPIMDSHDEESATQVDESDAVVNLLTWLQQEMAARPEKKSLIQRYQRELRRSYPMYLRT